MRDQNRLKEKFQLSLEGRQVASVVVGALVILGVVFVLGLNVGRQLGERERAARQPADPLAALDAPPPPPDAGEPPKLSYHEALTKKEEAGFARRRAEAKPEHEKDRPPSPQAAPPAPAAAQQPTGPGLGLGKPPLAAPSTSDNATLKSQKTTNFAIQVGATQDIGEAQRIADRFRGHKPRIVSVDIPGKGRWYRVKVGGFETRPEAERYLQDLARETSTRGFVTAFN